MKIDRAVILALPGGDEKPWSCARSGPKSLVPVANKPILFHALDALRAAGIGDAMLLTPPGSGEEFRGAIGDGGRWGMRIAYRETLAQRGVGAALDVAGAFLEDGPVAVHEADALLRAPLSDHMQRFSEDRLDALALVLAPERLTRPSPPQTVGYLLSPRAVAILRSGPPVSDPLARLPRRGAHVRMLDIEGCLACHGDEAMLLQANRHVLTGLRTEVTDAMLEDCELQGSVVIHPTATVRNTLIRGPAIIGAHAQIVDSYVGPYTSIGATTRIQGSEIEHSIVMDGATLMFVGSRLETSVIGRGARIVRRFEMPNAVRMSIGDGAEVALS